jgi:membrane AbrB-like protein
LRIPAGPLLVPLVVGAVLNVRGWLAPELPPWLLAASYGLIGWAVGLKFTPDILRYAARAFPRIAAAILTLMGACGLMAAALIHLGGVDPLTAYLATSPGGADSVAIIAASSGKTDVAFVMALQMVRAITVIFLGPPLARFIARQVRSGGSWRRGDRAERGAKGGSTTRATCQMARPSGERPGFLGTKMGTLGEKAKFTASRSRDERRERVPAARRS